MIPIPLNDNIRRQTFWACTLALIILNTVAFLYELSLGRELNSLIYFFGLIPARYASPGGVAILPHWFDFLRSALTAMFLHGGWLHLGGNMLFLFVFGRSIEDRFGHSNFLALYFASGFAAALLYVEMSAGSSVPSIGASGAIAGVLGAYFVCFPRARITTVLFLIFFFWTVHLPAVLVLGYWFLIQFVMGYRMLSIQSATGGGVAWWAHVGGFAAGIILGFVLRPRRPQVEIIRPA
ncbi:MAG TPA: rhomboid family intramembrane serine protease [Terriglobia bacterium]|nr:rhomboid family intramembrane serine protease [Terriglobia bacterium]